MTDDQKETLKRLAIAGGAGLAATGLGVAAYRRFSQAHAARRWAAENIAKVPENLNKGFRGEEARRAQFNVKDAFLARLIEILKESNFGGPSVSDLGGLGGIAAGISAGRNIAGNAAAGLAPRGRVTRSESVARSLAWAGAPIGGLAALALANKYKIPGKIMGSRAANLITKDLPTEAGEALSAALKGSIGFAGAAGGGLATGSAVGAIQKLRGKPGQAKIDDGMKSAFMAGFLSEVEKDAGLREMLAKSWKATNKTSLALIAGMGMGSIPTAAAMMPAAERGLSHIAVSNYMRKITPKAGFGNPGSAHWEPKGYHLAPNEPNTTGWPGGGSVAKPKPKG